MNTIIEKVIFLQNVNLFADIPTEQLSHLAAIAERVSVSKNTYLFREGDHSSSIFIVVNGLIHIRKNNKLLQTAGKYHEVGMLGFFDNAPRVAEAEAIEDTELLKINNIEFFDLLESKVKLSRGILVFFAKHIRSLLEAIDLKDLPDHKF